MKAIKERELCTLAFGRIVAMIDCFNSNDHAQSDVQKIWQLSSGDSIIDCFKGSYSADVVSISFPCQRVDRF